MQTIKLKNSELKSLLEGYFKEGIYDDNNQTGAVELNKQTNPKDIEKYTSQGMDVKLVDENSNIKIIDKTKSIIQNELEEETFGEEQEIAFKHKFEPDGALNIYASRDKVPFNKMMDYILSIKEKDQVRVHQALAKGEVTLFIKQASSGRYFMQGNISEKTYQKYLAMLKGGQTQNFAAKTELNENLTKLLIK